jgi:uncharacterized LabA/DUF88 family protein
MEGRACIFIDGENFRHSLLDAFRADGSFRASDYLPRNANWSGFFDWIVHAATAGTHHRLRTYWFVSQEIDCHPYGLTALEKPENAEKFRRLLKRQVAWREQLEGLTAQALLAKTSALLQELQDRQNRIEQRFKSWIAVQNAIALEHRAVEFRRAGAIPYNLFEERFGPEKCVDVRLASDMIVLKNIYDTAIIVSGDQDYVPAAQILKDAGKTVINVAFERRSGYLLPGGARRLNIVTDASLSVPHDELRNFMGFGAPLAFRSELTEARVFEVD